MVFFEINCLFWRFNCYICKGFANIELKWLLKLN